MQIRLAFLKFAVLGFSLHAFAADLPSVNNPTGTNQNNSNANSKFKIAAPVPPTPGAFDVETAEYKFPAKTDPDILSTSATELWARAYWPKTLTGQRPIVFLLHGNHSTCGEGTPRNDFDCSYTSEGACPVGQVVVPNHEGFNYLGKQLASLGYIAVSINANRGITCGNGTDADEGLILARGKLVLRHIEEWNKWAVSGGAPTSLGVAPDAFLNHIDITNVGLMGHSRGGEGVRAALALYRDESSIWPARIPNLKIRGIFEIGSVDGMAGRVLDADDTAWNQLLPMCDGDVSDLAGRQPFERMLKKISEVRKTPKSLTMVYGTNHNFYNSEWHSDDSYNCLNHKEVHGPGPESDVQQKVAAAQLSAFMLANVGADKNPSMGRMFDPSFAYPPSLASVTRVDRAHLYTFDRVYSAVVDDFDQATGTSSTGKPNQASVVHVKNEITETPTRMDVTWDSNGSDRFVQLNWADAGQGRDVSAYTSLDLRVGRALDQIKERPSVFSIALVDAVGRLSKSVLSKRYVKIDGPNNEEDLYQTIRISLSDFGIPMGATVQGVRLIFDKSEKGHLYVANVRFTTNNPLAFAGTLNTPLPWQTPIVSKKKKDDGDIDLFMGNGNVNATPIAAATPAPSPTPAQLMPNAPANNTRAKSNNSASLVVNKADIISTRVVRNSKYLSGRDAVEIAVETEKGNFPPEAQLPTLVLAGNQFSVSRYAPTGATNLLIFSVARKDVTNLPANGPAHVQYGRVNARKFWTLPDYDRNQLDR